MKNLTGRALHQRFLHCIEEKLDFVTLKPLGDKIEIVYHHELKEGVSVNFDTVKS